MNKDNIEHRRQELIDMSVRLKRGQEKFVTQNQKYKQPTVLEYIDWIDENISKLTKELEKTQE